MSVTITGGRMQKEGDAMTECADAWYHLVQGGPVGQELCAGRAGDDVTVRCAVADGATLSALPEPWARTLVRELCALPVRTLADPETLHAALRMLSDGWPAALRSYVTGLGRPLDWLEPHALQHGPAAAFVAVGVLPVPGGRRWLAAAVGDCCLFHTRGDQLVAAFPLDLPERFGHSPDLVRGLDCLGPGGLSVIRTATGWIRAGDTLLLASDALAKWALVQHTGGRPGWRTLTEVAVACAEPGPYEETPPGRYEDEAPGRYGDEAPGPAAEGQPGSYADEAPGPHAQGTPGSYGEDASGSYGEDASGPYGEDASGAAGGPPGDAGALRAFVGGLRETGAIEDDDVTLVAVRFLDDGWTSTRPGRRADVHARP
ncbi:hypothetical protein [Streptomyces sp. NPDC015131]|uniref:hypothetical protein n=1 Tax=Streptomyces sp. NPDC015131 TaxID=3364941 RepID=UPI0036F5B999